MFMDSMKEAVLQVLLDLKVHHPPGELQSDSVEGPFQPCVKEGTPLIINQVIL